MKNLLKPVDDPPFLQTICAIIVNVLLPSNTNSKNPEYVDLGKEVFSLIDAITYSLPAEYQSQLSHANHFLFHLALHIRRLAVIPQTPDVLTTMLSKDQSPSFLENSTRTLSYLSTRVLFERYTIPIVRSHLRRSRHFSFAAVIPGGHTRKRQKSRQTTAGGQNVRFVDGFE